MKRKLPLAPRPSAPRIEPPSTDFFELPLGEEQLLRWLGEEDPSGLEGLWRAADAVRREHVGDEVHLRGLIEISNHCRRLCGYCGIRADNREIERYRMSEEEILACAHEALSYGYGTVVLQAGEDPGLKLAWVRDLVRRIKDETGLAVTLSLGERGMEELKAWQEAGADRYLLRFETSDPELYGRIHPSLPHALSDRIALLHALRQLGYEVGSGVMVGFPGQTWKILAQDILTFAQLDLDMIGVGPFIAHPATPLGKMQAPAHEDQVPATEEVVYRAIALTRLTCPESNIPSTTALATINKTSGRELGLMRGANIVMPNLTPVAYRSKYEIYPEKACINETAAACQGCLAGRIVSIGRQVGTGPGGRRRSAGVV
jgi:biotin synthase